MPYQDVRDYIEELTRRDLLHVIDEPVSKDTELVPLVRLQFRGLEEEKRKAFWFRSITDARGRDFDGSVLLGGSGTAVRNNDGHGVVVDAGGAAWLIGQPRIHDNGGDGIFVAGGALLLGDVSVDGNGGSGVTVTRSCPSPSSGIPKNPVCPNRPFQWSIARSPSIFSITTASSVSMVNVFFMVSATSGRSRGV